MHFKKIKILFISLPIALAMLFGLAVNHAYGKPPQPNIIPATIDVTPYSQSVTSYDGYRAEWTVGIDGEGTYYTLYVTFGDGGYLNRPYLSPDTYYYNWYYDAVSPGWYYQTWTISGVGGPAQDTSQVNRYP